MPVRPPKFDSISVKAYDTATITALFRSWAIPPASPHFQPLRQYRVFLSPLLAAMNRDIVTITVSRDDIVSSTFSGKVRSCCTSLIAAAYASSETKLLSRFISTKKVPQYIWERNGRVSS